MNIGKTNKKSAATTETNLSSDDLNYHFSTVAENLLASTNDNRTTPRSYLPPKPGKPLYGFERFTPASICLSIKSIDNKKSTGPDSISIKMLKVTLPYILNLLTDMFNRILSDGIYPSLWKTARVVPIFKTGDKNVASNYRPISVLSMLSKIFEIHINNCLKEHIFSNNYISTSQSGFRKGHSCTQAVHKILNDVTEHKKFDRCVVGLFLDFSKAFDCVNHDILLSKLESFNVKGLSLQIIASFLRGRHQFVSLNGMLSQTLPIKVGVPQGSVLAPTLFQIFIDDILRLPISSSSYAYADDTVFICGHSNPHSLENLCNNDLLKISDWCLENKMTINVKKSHFLSFKSKGTQFNFTIMNKPLQETNETKLLGFTICKSLTWNSHVENVISLVDKKICLLRLCRRFLTTFSSKQFYYQFIHCHLIQGIQIYYSLSPKYLRDSLYLCQKTAIRIIANVHFLPPVLSSTSSLCKQFSILPLPTLHKYFCSIYAYHIFIGNCPDYLSEIFVRQQHKYPVRNKYLMYNPSDHLNSSIVTIFNSLPKAIRSSNTTSTFKKRLIIYFSTNS